MKFTYILIIGPSSRKAKPAIWDGGYQPSGLRILLIVRWIGNLFTGRRQQRPIRAGSQLPLDGCRPPIQDHKAEVAPRWSLLFPPRRSTYFLPCKITTEEASTGNSRIYWRGRFCNLFSMEHLIINYLAERVMEVGYLLLTGTSSAQ